MAKTRKLSAGLQAWTAHWKKIRAEMEKKGTFKKGDNLTKVFKEAKKSFKHHKKGGDDPAPAPAAPVEETAAPAAGRRRRGGKTKRRPRKY